MSTARAPLGILYEHPEWFKPMFIELDRRGLAYEHLRATDLRFNPSDHTPPYALVVNRMSPSAYLRGHGHGLFATLAYLRYLDTVGVPVVNGADAFALELSKTAQIALLSRLGLPHPRTRVINTAAEAKRAAHDLIFPLVIKPNIGGSGAKIQRYESPDALAAAVANGAIDLGIDQVGLVQEYHPPAGGAIVRVEVLDGRFLYAIKVFPNPDAGFNLCPADICQPGEAPPQHLDLCPVELPRTSLRVEGYTPPPDAVASVLRIADVAGIDVGGIEYLVSERDGRLYFYDINVLSNFVTDAPRVVGFDPFPVLVDYLERRASAAGGARPQ